MSEIFLTSDHHWGNTNIIKYSNRPFIGPLEMDKILIENWNNVVKPQDSVYHLGDLTFSTFQPYLENLLKSLNGKIFLIKGNHDYFAKKSYSNFRFEWIKDYYELGYDSRKVIMCHYPILSWRNMRHGSFHVHGHSHGRLNELNKSVLRLDIGVDSFNYSPINIDEVFNILETREKQIKIDRPESTLE